MKLTVDDMDLRRQVNIVTMRGRQHSPAVAAFFREVARIDSKGLNPIEFNHAAEKFIARQT